MEQMGIGKGATAYGEPTPEQSKCVRKKEWQLKLVYADQNPPNPTYPTLLVTGSKESRVKLSLGRGKECIVLVFALVFPAT